VEASPNQALFHVEKILDNAAASVYKSHPLTVHKTTASNGVPFSPVTWSAIDTSVIAEFTEVRNVAVAFSI
jgi:hypothetical protein